MKKLLFIAVILISCQKQEIRRATKCPTFDHDEFVDTWTWQKVKHPGQQWEDLDMGILQDIVITPDTMYYLNVPTIREPWYDLQCSMIDNGASQTLFVEIYNDTLHYTGLADGTEWILTK